MDKYDEKYHRPVIVGSCGHTICSTCTGRIGLEMYTKCPVCRSMFNPTRVTTNYAVIELIKAIKTGNTDEPRYQREASNETSAYPIRQLRSGNEVIESIDRRDDGETNTQTGGLMERNFETRDLGHPRTETQYNRPSNII